MRTILLLGTFVLSTCLPAGAELYQWVDEHGVVTFKDTPPPTKKRGKVKVYTDSDFGPAPPVPVETSPRSGTAKKTAAPVQKERFSGTVEMYATSWCGYCKQAERYMQSRGIAYVSYDIEKDSAAAQRHRELGGRGVPLLVIGPHRMSGFSPSTLEYYLNKP